MNSDTLQKLLSAPAPLQLCGVPDGLDAQIVARMAEEADRPVLFVARDDARAQTLSELLEFFAPSVRILRLPAWDCLPYDRVSPNSAIVAERVAALGHLAGVDDAAPKHDLIITTVSAVLQRVPPKDFIAGASFVAKVGQQLDLESLTTFLERNGYNRASTVMEPGDYAMRGGIIDLFAPSHDAPLRLDLFGDEIETIRTFDPLTQRSLEKIGEFQLLPVSELPLDAQSIKRFRQGYVAQFGASLKDDPLYEAVSAGRRYHGMEHWLALFHDRMETLFDYLPDCLLVADQLADEAITARLQTIKDHFDARQELLEATPAGDMGAPTYKPLPIDQLYLSEADWQAGIDGVKFRSLNAFSIPIAPGVVDFAGKQGRSFAAERANPESNIYEVLRDYVSARVRDGQQVLFAAFSEGSRERLAQVLKDHGLSPLALADDFAEFEKLPRFTLGVSVLPLDHGYDYDKLTVIAEQDVLGDRMVRRVQKRKKAADFISDATSLGPGDLVVHADHGIARYMGLMTIDVMGAPHDCLLLHYHNDDKLYLPVENIELLSRFGGEGEEVNLDRLGGTAWQSRKSRLKKRLKDMAEELIRIAAARELNHTAKIAPPSGLYDEFSARFPYEETEDQQGAINDVIDDFARGHPMDRLVCGDVGFGKTEIALRAAFVAAMAGRQVAIVVPTTLLARQHFKSVSERFKGLPVRIAQLSRLVSGKEANETKKALTEGQVDIVIGTHALLQKSVQFKDLGLLIVDEEQHFGVKHKERLKELRADVHVLTLTATPIPRTLQLAMTGVRDLSIIATPPVDRLAIRTFVMPFDPVVAREALLREHYRGGQSFYVCPRIADLPEIAEFLTDYVPEVKFAIAHGQMPASELEDIMTAFYDGHYDVLVSTTIVESGLDIPSANTMLVHRADMFGLAQLYQIRGRIGRSKTRAYAYLTHRPNIPLTDSAEKRLKVLQSLDTLGAGFTLASHDLDLRGAGNLLGEEQSGHIKEVGFELYREMLEEAIASLREGGSGDIDDQWSPQINLGAAVLIPETYIEDLNLRLSLYRRLSDLQSEDEIDGMAAEMIDRFGPLPDEVEFLLKIVAIKQACRKAGIAKLDAGPKGATVAFRNDEFANPGALIEFVQSALTGVKLRPDMKLVYIRDWESTEARVKGVHHLARKLANLAGIAEAA